jgi:HK97 family phage major capsid protein
MATKLDLMLEEARGKRTLLKKDMSAKPDFNYTQDEIDDFQRRQKDLNVLQDKIKTQREIEELDEENNRELAILNAPERNVPFAGGKADKKFLNGREQEEPKYIKTIGEIFVESKAFKSYDSAQGKGEVGQFDLKTVFATTAAAGGGTLGFAPEVTRVPGLLVDYRLRQPVMDSIIPMGRTSQQAVQYMEELVPVNGAAYVNENDATTGESEIKFVERTVNVRKIRTSIPVTDEMLADAPMMIDVVNSRLLELITLKKDQDLLTGTGTGSPAQIAGLLASGNGRQTQAKNADPIPDAIYKGMTNIAVNAFLDADHVVIHPLDWQNIRLMRTPDGVYIFGSPLDPNPTRIWGLPVTPTLAIPQGSALVGAYRVGSQQFIRQDYTMQISNEHDQNFMKGILSIKIELRLALVLYRPAAFCEVTGL